MSEGINIVIIFLAAFSALITFFIVILFFIYVNQVGSTDIFYRLRRHYREGGLLDSENDNLLNKTYKFIKNISKPFATWNLAQFIEKKLRQAGIPLLGSEYIVIVLLGSAAIFAAAYMVTLEKRIALICAFSLPLVVWTILLALIKQRRESFTEQLSDCLTTVANALRAGYSFQQAVDVVAKEMEPPISDEFARVANDVSMGISLDEALEQMARRVESSDFDLVVTAVLIQREIGGNLAQVLDSISDTIIERIRMKREINALTAQGRLSAVVLLLLPFFVGAFMYVFNHDQFILLLEEPAGQIALVVSLIMEVIGIFVIKKIIEIDV